MKELEAIYPVLNVDKAKDADESFKSFIQNVFDKKVVSSVYLTGEGFENNWYPNSLKVLCNGRRAFSEIIFTVKVPAIRPCVMQTLMTMDRFILMGRRLTEQISCSMRMDAGQEGWYPIVPGEHTGMKQMDSGK